MSSNLRTRRPLTPNKPSIRARQAALNASRVPEEPTPLVIDQLASKIDARPFLRLARESLDGNLLHYSDRLRLLRDADRMRIGRFEANLLIATVQHEARKARCFVQNLQHISGAAHSRTAAKARTSRILFLTTALLVAEFLALRFVMQTITI